VTQGVLYISYDGMLEPLGQSQVLAYLEKLAPGRRIHLISFEKSQDWRDRHRRAAVARRIADAGIDWHPLRYHKSPTAPATAFDVAVGTARAIAMVRRHKLGIVHARSYVAALIALSAKRATGAAFLFDMRGFWADERVDGGLWPRDGRLYRLTKALERRFLEAADQVVTLTHASRLEIGRFDYLKGRLPPIAVIPTCADLDRFTIQGPPQREPFTLGYIGSVGTWYMLEEMLLCFSTLRQMKPGARLLIINRDEQSYIRERVSAHRLDASAVEIIAADHRDMPSMIGRMSAGMALIKPVYSKIASAPTKLAEYLGCGVPCLGNTDVGDVAGILEDEKVGAPLSDFSEQSIRSGLQRLLALTGQADLQQRCRSVAQRLFSLEGGVASYAEIYGRLSAISEQ